MSLHEALGPLYDHLFTLGADQVTVAELAGFITGAWGVWLCMRRKISNFAVGIANNIFFLLLFLDARLYADAWLQVVFLILGIQGWWAWLRLGPNKSHLRVRRTGVAHLAGIVVVMALSTVLLTGVLRQAHDIAPFYDALTTSLSLGAQWLLNLKRLENWALWIIADVIYIPLYFSKNLDLTAIVYAIFLILCIVGARDWRRSMTKDAAMPEAVSELQPA